MANLNKKIFSGLILYILIILVCMNMAFAEIKPILSPPIVERIFFHSELLNKDIRLQVYLPQGYQSGQTYPVLYLIHGYDKDESILQEAGFDQSATQLIESNRINPLIIVSPQIDNSYGINSAQQYSELSGSTGNSVFYGMYEDYLIKEVVPMIDAKYHTIPLRGGRYIGGISMGGHVALHLGFYYNQLFSKIGGHMPAISLGGMEEWLYPTEKLQHERDPLLLAKEKDLPAVKVYLDSGKNDRYRTYEGCEELYEILKNKGVSVENHLNEGTHSTTYIRTQVDNYLLFYAGIKN